MADTKRDTRLPLVPLSDFVCLRVLDLLRPYRPLADEPDLN